jgi:hypothetical protein
MLFYGQYPCARHSHPPVVATATLLCTSAPHSSGLICPWRHRSNPPCVHCHMLCLTTHAHPTAVCFCLQVMCCDYGFRSNSGRLYQEGYGKIPLSMWHLVRQQQQPNSSSSSLTAAAAAAVATAAAGMPTVAAPTAQLLRQSQLC